MSKNKRLRIKNTHNSKKLSAIITRQSIPEDVALRFLDAKGKLYKDKKGKLNIAKKSK